MCLPEQVDGRPLSVIGMKAFLSCKSVERLTLPKTLERVEDWGFAHMKNLREIVMPAKELSLGKRIFMGCEKLRRVTLSGVPEGAVYEGIPYFLATALSLFEEETLQSLRTTGLLDLEGTEQYPDDILHNLSIAGDREGQWKWLFVYDKALEAYLRRGDEEGFVPAFIGWFDVEDVDDQKQGYVRGVWENKLRLVFQRLLYPEALAEETADFFYGYLREKTPFLMERCVEWEDFRSDIRFCRIWKASGGLTPKRAGELLDKVPDEPELRGFLLESMLEESGAGRTNYFAKLEL